MLWKTSSILFTCYVMSTQMVSVEDLAHPHRAQCLITAPCPNECFLFWRIKFKKITSKNHNSSRILWSPVISSRSKSKFLPWNIKHCFARYLVFIGFKYTLIIISEAILKHWPSLADMDDHSSGRDDWVEFSIILVTYFYRHF